MSKVKGQGQRGDEYAVAVLKGPCPPPRVWDPWCRAGMFNKSTWHLRY